MQLAGSLREAGQVPLARANTGWLSRMTGSPAPPSQDIRDQVTGNLTRTCLPQTAAGAETWEGACVPAVFFLILDSGLCLSAYERPGRARGGGGGVGAA